MTDADNLMDFAARTLQGAGELTLRHFGSAAVEWKRDGSEVTAADRAAEEHVRAAIADAFPDDGVLGEEGEDRPSRSGRRWVVDPIDGTRSFASGVPLYSMLLTLEVDGAAVLGCCHLPVQRETLVAAAGAGAWVGGKRAQVSECGDLAAASPAAWSTGATGRPTSTAPASSGCSGPRASPAPGATASATSWSPPGAWSCTATRSAARRGTSRPSA
jgi:histidinol-phosphatase